MEYTLIENDLGATFIKRINDDGSISWIPADDTNSDYQTYLASLDA